MAKKKDRRGPRRTRRGRLTRGELDTIRASETQERAERDYETWSEFGDRNSVRTVSGGLPTLGKR